MVFQASTGLYVVTTHKTIISISTAEKIRIFQALNLLSSERVYATELSRFDGKVNPRTSHKVREGE
jgi:hypothetical protein